VCLYTMMDLWNIINEIEIEKLKYILILLLDTIT